MFPEWGKGTSKSRQLPKVKQQSRCGHVFNTTLWVWSNRLPFKIVSERMKYIYWFPLSGSLTLYWLWDCTKMAGSRYSNNIFRNLSQFISRLCLSQDGQSPSAPSWTTPGERTSSTPIFQPKSLIWCSMACLRPGTTPIQLLCPEGGWLVSSSHISTRSGSRYCLPLAFSNSPHSFRLIFSLAGRNQVTSLCISIVVSSLGWTTKMTFKNHSKPRAG